MQFNRGRPSLLPWVSGRGGSVEAGTWALPMTAPHPACLAVERGRPLRPQLHLLAEAPLCGLVWGPGFLAPSALWTPQCSQKAPPRFKEADSLWRTNAKVSQKHLKPQITPPPCLQARLPTRARGLCWVSALPFLSCRQQALKCALLTEPQALS